MGLHQVRWSLFVWDHSRMSRVVFVKNVKVGLLDDAEQGGFYLTWDSTQHRYYFATIEDVREALGGSANLSIGGQP